jgi:hypothetical protein
MASAGEGWPISNKPPGIKRLIHPQALPAANFCHPTALMSQFSPLREKSSSKGRNADILLAFSAGLRKYFV